MKRHQYSIPALVAAAIIGCGVFAYALAEVVGPGDTPEVAIEEVEGGQEASSINFFRRSRGMHSWLKPRLNELEGKISELREVVDGRKPEDRQVYKEALRRLESKKKKVAKLLEVLESGSGENWDATREQVMKTYQEAEILYVNLLKSVNSG